MMFHYPYFSSPYDNRYSRYGYRYPSYGYAPVSPGTIPNTSSSSYRETVSSPNHTKKEECSKPKDPPKEDRKVEESTDEPLFEIMGIQLYFDDILIVCLLLFLYLEGVKDYSLFISLILLLLS